MDTNKLATEILSELREESWKRLAVDRAMPRLVELLELEDDNVTLLKAIVEVLNRAYGKTAERTEITGKDGAPLFLPLEIIHKNKLNGPDNESHPGAERDSS